MKRKAKNRPPDDILRWGPLEIARFGRTVYARSVMTPEEFDIHLERLAKQVPAVAAEIKQRVARISEIVRAVEPLSLLKKAWWSALVGQMGVSAESEMGNEHVVAMRMIDYVQSVIASVPPDSEQVEASDAVMQELRKNVDELFQLVNGVYLAARTAERRRSEPGFDEQHEELYSKAQLYWTTVRGDRYPGHLIEQLRDFLTPQDAILRDAFDVSADEIVTNIEKIERSLTLGASEVGADFRSFQKDVLDAMGEELAASGRKFADYKELGDDTIEKRGWSERRDSVFDRLDLGLFDLQKITSLPEAFLRELSWAPGEEPTFFGGEDMQGWPLRIWPIHLRPFLFVGGRYYVFDMFAVRDHIYRVISRAVFRLRPERKNEWDEAQKNASEGSAITLISKLVGGARSFGPVHYQWPPTPSPKKNWRECDGVVIAELDEHLFIVEVKAGAFTYTAPANDFPAHIVSANALIDTPLGQGRKLLEYLQSADEVPIFDGDHHEVARLRHDRFKTILLCGITLDVISDLAAQAEHLKPLGVDVGSTPVWSVSLDDLRVMRDLLSNPLIFLHYLRQRRRAVASPIIKIDDELDHLALYLTHNDYLAVAQSLGGTQPPIWNAYKEPIDRYYHALLADPPTAVIPSQKMPGLLRQILDVLASEPKPGRFDVAATLLDLDPKGRSQVAMMIDGSLARQRNTGRVMPTSAYGATPLTIFCWHDSVVSRDAVYARELTLGVASLAGEEKRLLLELTFDADDTLVAADFEWLRPASIAPDERTRIDELARNIYEQRVSKQEKKIGRNDPCPCGSGKKYKKCHGV